MRVENKKLLIKTIQVGELQTNCYIVADKDKHQGIIVDPGADADIIKKEISILSVSISAIINTHGHIDHTGANSGFDYPVWIHRLDADCLTDSNLNLSYFLGLSLKSKRPSRLLEDGDIIDVGSIAFRCIHTPGHTPGSICLYTEGCLFSGDTLFHLGVGRTDLPGGSQERLEDSIRNKILVLPKNTIVYPGHGISTTIRIAQDSHMIDEAF
jgi:glyoxylase-like metal-dependent hydrolase (beta-lactamase superfamily II)